MFNIYNKIKDYKDSEFKLLFDDRKYKVYKIKKNNLQKLVKQGIIVKTSHKVNLEKIIFPINYNFLENIDNYNKLMNILNHYNLSYKECNNFLEDESFNFTFEQSKKYVLKFLDLMNLEYYINKYINNEYFKDIKIKEYFSERVKNLINKFDEWEFEHIPYTVKELNIYDISQEFNIKENHVIFLSTNGLISSLKEIFIYIYKMKDENIYNNLINSLIKLNKHPEEIYLCLFFNNYTNSYNVYNNKIDLLLKNYLKSWEVNSPLILYNYIKQKNIHIEDQQLENNFLEIYNDWVNQDKNITSDKLQILKQIYYIIYKYFIEPKPIKKENINLSFFQFLILNINLLTFTTTINGSNYNYDNYFPAQIKRTNKILYSDKDFNDSINSGLKFYITLSKKINQLTNLNSLINNLIFTNLSNYTKEILVDNLIIFMKKLIIEINKCKNSLVFYNDDGFGEYQNYSYKLLPNEKEFREKLTSNNLSYKNTYHNHRIFDIRHFLTILVGSISNNDYRKFYRDLFLDKNYLINYDISFLIYLFTIIKLGYYEIFKINNCEKYDIKYNLTT